MNSADKASIFIALAFIIFYFQYEWKPLLGISAGFMLGSGVVNLLNLFFGYRRMCKEAEAELEFYKIMENKLDRLKALIDLMDKKEKGETGSL